MTVVKTGSGTLASSPAGIDCGSVCSSSFVQGTLVHLLAAPDSGWHLDHFSGACSGSECAVTLNSSSTVAVVFTQDAVATVPSACAAYSGPALSSLTHYEGMMHQHSSYSDGDINSTPTDYFSAGKGFGYSYTASAEHSDTDDIGVYVDTGAQCEATVGGLIECVTPSADRVVKWSSTLKEATAITDDSFLGMRGFEWTSDRFGHINVFMSANFANAKTDGGYIATMQTFYDWFTRSPTTPGDGGGLTNISGPAGGGADGLATFNHPGDKCDLAAYGDTGCDWNGFTYIPAAADRMFGIEAYNHDQQDDKYQPFIVTALDQGWHLSFIGAEDDHAATFGQDARPKTVTMSTALTASAFKSAWLARRTYALAPGQHLRATMSVEGYPMGSTLPCDLGKTVLMNVNMTNKDGSPFSGTLQLFTDNGVKMAESSTAQSSFQIPVLAGTHWYFVRVHGANGKSVAYLAPVWIQSR
jgi:hypothetical protein